MNDDIRAKAKALRLALEPFRDVRPVMSIDRLIAFLTVAESEAIASPNMHRMWRE